MEEDIYLIVKSIDLLTLEEAQDLPKYIRAIGWQWWLQSPGREPLYAAYVRWDGSINNLGNSLANRDVSYQGYCVRPVLLIENLDALNLPLYTELEIFNEEWIYIGNNKALAKKSIFESRFDVESNEYATSEIKQKLDTWLEEQKNKFNEN